MTNSILGDDPDTDLRIFIIVSYVGWKLRPHRAVLFVVVCPLQCMALDITARVSVCVCHAQRSRNERLSDRYQIWPHSHFSDRACMPCTQVVGGGSYITSKWFKTDAYYLRGKCSAWKSLSKNVWRGLYQGIRRNWNMLNCCSDILVGL